MNEDVFKIGKRMKKTKGFIMKKSENYTANVCREL